MIKYIQVSIIIILLLFLVTILFTGFSERQAQMNFCEKNNMYYFGPSDDSFYCAVYSNDGLDLLEYGSFDGEIVKIRRDEWRVTEVVFK